MSTTYRTDVIPGATKALHLDVTDAETGEAVDLAGAAFEAVIRGGTVEEIIEPTPVVGVRGRLLVLVSAAATTALAGRQARLRAWVTPAASLHTTAIDAVINVKP